jgi:replicative DNA helicase Mcm
VLGAFETRHAQARADLDVLDDNPTWETLSRLKDRYHVSQRELASGSRFTQQQVSKYWGERDDLKGAITSRLTELIESVEGTDLSTFRSLVTGGVKWRRVSDAEGVTANHVDDRIPVLRGKLADILGCSSEVAVERGRELLASEPSASSWSELREELARHDVSHASVAAALDTNQSTVTRWLNERVTTDRFDEVRSTALDSVSETRQRIRHLLDEIGERQQTKVYDLTVEGTANFVANGMIVHNSEDRSAMHEALEQQSYHPDTEVLLSDGRRVRIGDFVDTRMRERSDDVVEGVDCEILPVDDVGVHSVDLETNETTKRPVDRMSRHEAPDEFVSVEFSNGRSVTVTPEHPMFVDRDGDIDTVEAREIEEGAFVPAPRKLPNSTAAVEFDGEPHLGKERDVDLPEGLTEDLAEALGLLVAEGHSYAGSSHEIGFSNQDERLLARMDQLMTDAFGLASTDTTNEAGTVTKRWVSTKLYRWFERNVPELMETARGKRIPARVLGASEEHIRRFLVGAFAGDGGVESEAMAFSTSSRGLADDYADALSKLGVASRIHYNSAEDSWKTYVMGDSTERFVQAVVEPADERYQKAMGFVERSNGVRRHHDVLPTSAARELRSLRSLVGLVLTGQFRPNLDEGYGVQVETVMAHLGAIRDRIEAVRASLTTANDLAAVRSAVDWSGRELAERVDGMTTSAVHYGESGGYDERTRSEMADRARTAIHDALDEVERRADALEARADLRYYRVTDVDRIANAGEHATEWVYDVTVEPTNTFVSQGVVLHNSISISKAGINATLKSRCSLLGAANPKYGRFDQYEPIGEQIDLEPALVSRFDLIFTVTDQPDPEKDGDLADHILQTNYAGELHTQRSRMTNSDFSQAEVDAATEEVEPAIDPDLLRKYIAHAKRNIFPTMTEEARAAIREFYVDLRARGADEDAPVPVTARKLEALVRLAEASARVRLSDTVEPEDAERVIGIVRSCLEAIGVDPETGEFDADVIETGRSKTQRDRIKNLKGLISTLEDEFETGAPLDEVLDRAETELGLDRSKAEDELEKLRRKGEVYEPHQGHLRTT